MAFKLSIEQGKGRGQAFDFDAGQITIGRTEENDVVLYEQGVSRRHARIVQQSGRWFLEDMESANGTLLNGTKVQREALQDGDRIGIGDVVFRFGTGAKPSGADAEASTRVVALSKEERAPAPTRSTSSPRPAPDAGPSLAGPAPDAGAFNPRIVAVSVALALLAAIAWAALNGQRPVTADKLDCPGSPSEPIVLSEVKSEVVGSTGEAICHLAGRDLYLGFKGQPRTRYLFYWSPFYTESGQIEVLLNGQKVGESPLAPTRRSSRREITFSENDVKAGLNVITLHAARNGEWGVERLDLLPIPLDESSAEEGSKHFEFGSRLYEQKNVAAANLYNAYEELRTARQLMEGLPDPKPASYVSAKSLLQDIEQELDSLCQSALWSAKRDAKYGKYAAANDQYKYILQAFPGDDHPCRAEALKELGGPERATQKLGMSVTTPGAGRR